MNSSSIRNIILDFGAVLINIDYKLTYDAFRSLGIHDIENRFSPANQQELFDKFEMGMIDPQTFYSAIKTTTGVNATNEQIRDAWNAMLLDLPQKRIDFLKQLKQKYRVFLLSNTNEVHVEAFSAQLKEVYGYDIFLELFEKAYFSNVIGLRKPNANIFEFVLKTHNLDPKETVFVDDVKKNVDAAIQCGINGILLEPGTDVTEILKEY